MSPIIITIAVISLICAGVTLVIFVQAREKAKLERVRKINMLNDRHNSLSRLLDELPPQYLTTPLRVLLLEQSIETVKELNKLRPSSRNASYLEDDEKKLKELVEQNTKIPSIKIDDEAKAREARQLLQTLYKFLHSLQRRKQISAEQAKQHMAQVAYLAHKSKSDMHVARAEMAIGIGKPRVAIHNYHSAIEALKDVATVQEAAESIQYYQQQVAKLSKQADQTPKKAAIKQVESAQKNEEWEEFLSDGEDWKKKNTYDD